VNVFWGTGLPLPTIVVSVTDEVQGSPGENFENSYFFSAIWTPLADQYTADPIGSHKLGASTDRSVSLAVIAPRIRTVTDLRLW